MNGQSRTASTGVLPFDGTNLRRVRARDPTAARAIELAARLCGIPAELILKRDRPHDVCRARHLAIYLLHVTLHRTMAEAAGIVGRDRSSAQHACARIEEEREDPVFDAEVSRLETILEGEPVETLSAAG